MQANASTREIVHIHYTRLLHSNKPDEAKVKQIADNFDPSQFGIIPVYPVQQLGQVYSSYLMTDGNHRTDAALAKGYELIPCVLLTHEEYEYVKFSKDTVDLKCVLPKRFKVIPKVDDYETTAKPNIKRALVSSK